MDSGKQADIKERLDALESLPGESFDKVLTWEKLHRRLKDKPRRKGIVWLWAAACLLPLVLFLLLRTNSKNESVLVKNIDRQKQTITKPTTPAAFVQKEKMVPTPMAAIEKNQSLKNIPSNLHNKPVNKTNYSQISEPLIVNTNKTIETIPEPIAKIALPVDTPDVIAAFAKKKLRVVHLNELETAPVNTEQMASSSSHEKNNFKLIRFGGSQAANATAVGEQVYASGLKIPLTN